MTPKDQALRDEIRKSIRAYYNNTFEYAINQLNSKGDIKDILADAENKQRALDDPCIDQIMALFAKYIREAENERN